MTAILTGNNITKTYQDGKTITNVLNHLDISINSGERIAIVGTSGLVKVPCYISWVA